MVTTRQYIVLRLYYVEGWTLRRIGQAFGVSFQAVHQTIGRGRRWIFEVCGDQGVDASPLVRGLLAPSPTSSPTSNVGLAASRQEELLDALELLMEHRAAEAASFEECMSGDSFLQTHAKRNSFDQWEMRYAMARHCLQIPTSAYEARSCWKYSDAGLT